MKHTFPSSSSPFSHSSSPPSSTPTSPLLHLLLPLFSLLLFTFHSFFSSPYHLLFPLLLLHHPPSPLLSLLLLAIPSTSRLPHLPHTPLLPSPPLRSSLRVLWAAKRNEAPVVLYDPDEKIWKRQLWMTVPFTYELGFKCRKKRVPLIFWELRIREFKIYNTGMYHTDPVQNMVRCLMLDAWCLTLIILWLYLKATDR